MCYADKYNEAVINFDGSVFKCTARDYSPEKADGKLLANGEIEWKVDQVAQRLFVGIPKICQECGLLPTCQGICSQKIIENGENVVCALEENGISKSNYIVYNFNRKFYESKKKK